MAKLFAFYDDKAMFFTPPVAAPNVDALKRSLCAAFVEKVDASFVRYPADFILYEIGEFDDITGICDGMAIPRRVCSFTEIFAQLAT